MLKYFYNVESGGVVYSVDMIRIHFEMKDTSMSNLHKIIENNFRYEYFSSYGAFSYRNLFTINLSNGGVVSIGTSLNGLKSADFKRCFIEFNPNKCLPSNEFYNLYGFIVQYSIDLFLSRFDFAIDIPLPRQNFILVKDQRIYKVVAKSLKTGNYSEYLGERNKNGYVKLYNKKHESGLDYELTRLEITLDSFDYELCKKAMPKVYVPKNVDMYTMFNLKETELVLLNYLMADTQSSMINFLKLGRKMQQKLKPFLFGDYEFVDFDANLFSKIKYFYEDYLCLKNKRIS